MKAFNLAATDNRRLFGRFVNRPLVRTFTSSDRPGAQSALYFLNDWNRLSTETRGNVKQGESERRRAALNRDHDQHALIKSESGGVHAAVVKPERRLRPYFARAWLIAASRSFAATGF